MKERGKARPPDPLFDDVIARECWVKGKKCKPQVAGFRGKVVSVGTTLHHSQEGRVHHHLPEGREGLHPGRR